MNIQIAIPYREVFNQAMSSYSRIQTGWILEALEGYDFSKVQYICDVGGGQGHLLCSILAKYPQTSGIVLELENVINNKELLWANKMGVQDRCTYMAGNMFDEVPKADAYIMKMILHDWSDDECVKILSKIHDRSSNEGTVFVAEHMVPGPQIPHFSKLFDIHMMCVATGRERTAEEYSDMLRRAGWSSVSTFYSHSGQMGVIHGSR